MPSRLLVRAPALVLLLTVALAAPAHADPPAEGGGPGAGQAGGSAPGTAGPRAEAPPAAGGAGASGPEPFVPTEKISADSAISFPVDI